MRIFFLAGLLAAPSGLRAKMSPREFDRAREEVRLLALERLRSAPEDPRTLVTGEKGLRALHDAYKVEGSTPTVDWAADAALLRKEGKSAIRLRAAGRGMVQEARVESLLARRWAEYQRAWEDLQQSVADARRAGAAESATYWASLRAFDRLAEETRLRLVHNTPPQEKSLEGALGRDRKTLLLALEFAPKKTRSPRRVVVPVEHAPAVTLDPAAFFRAVDQVPDRAPEIVGAFQVPVGCRSVTERRAGYRWVARPAGGQGVAYVGSQEVDFRYGYLVVPPETPFYFENTGGVPLDIEFVGILP